MSTITCNEEMTGNATCKKLHRVHLCLDGKRVVDFLLAVIEFFSLALAAAALLSEICRNRRFPMGVGQFERKF